MARRRRSGWARAGDAALAVAAALGAVCIVLAIAAVFFDVRIIMFRTGSMSPTIPAGAAAIVHGIPASEVEIGDVITVDRTGELPVTHRVVAIAAVPGDADARLITMRGDANPVDDPYPYQVTRVRQVLFSVPGIAPALASLGNPWVLGSVTIAASTLIVVVFWPRRRREAPPPDPTPDATAAPTEQPRDGSVARQVTGTTLALLLAVAVVVGTPAPARAATTETIIQGSVIRLVSIESAAMQQLTPGGSAVWQVGVSADAESPGTLTVTIAGTAAPQTELRYNVQGCPQQWTSATCAGSQVLVADSPAPTDGAPILLQTMPDDAQLWLRVEVSLPTDADPAASPLQLTVRVTGVGDDVSAGTGGGGLAATGGAAGWTLAAVAVVVSAIGAGMLLRTRRPT
jgi:signal peptidase